jgi:hypothetical protein
MIYSYEINDYKGNDDNANTLVNSITYSETVLMFVTRVKQNNNNNNANRSTELEISDTGIYTL